MAQGSLAVKLKEILLMIAMSVCMALPAQAAEANSDVLDLKEVASLLRVNKKDVIKLVRTKGLPGREIAGSWRFWRPAVLAWLGCLPINFVLPPLNR